MADEDEAANLPLPARVAHKGWKVRLAAYQEIASRLARLAPDSDWNTYADFLKGMATDSNLAAQEAGLAAVLAWVQHAPRATRTRAVIVPALLDKALTATRPATRATALDIILAYVEIDTGEPVVELLLPGLAHKTPKVVAATVFAITEGVRLFGIPVVNPRPVLKHVPALFDHRDATVRSQATLLCVELYRWLRDAIQPALKDLRPAQSAELNEQFAAVAQQPPPQPERYTRADAAARGGNGPPAFAAAGDVPVETGLQPSALAAPASAAPVALDSYDLADPVDVLSRIPSDTATGMVAAKWADRRDALKAVYAAADTPRVSPDGRYGELLNALAKRVADANIIVATLAIQCIGLLARGLRRAFGPYRTIVMQPLIEKLKEKKVAVLEALRETADHIAAWAALADLHNDLMAGLKHKNPQVRGETLGVLMRRCAGKPGSTLKLERADAKALFTQLATLVDDPDGQVRDAATETVATLMTSYGERVLLPFIENVDKLRSVKIKELFDQKVSGHSGAGGAAASTGSVARLGGSSSSLSGGPGSTGTRTVPSFGATKRLLPGAKSASTGSLAASSGRSSTTVRKKPSGLSGAAGSAALPAAPAVDLSVSVSPSQAEEQLTAVLGDAVMAQITSSAWKDRLGAFSHLVELIGPNQPPPLRSDAFAVFCVEKEMLKDNNFQVATAVCRCLEKVVEGLSPGAVALVIPPLVEKLGDMKIKRVAAEVLTKLVCETSLNLVLSQMYASVRALKAPKAIADALTWMTTVLIDSGGAGVAFQPLGQFVAPFFAHTNPQVRSAAIQLVVKASVYDAHLPNLLGDVPPATLTILQAELAKVRGVAPPAPSLVQKGVAAAPTSTANAAPQEPAVDLSSRLPTGLVAELNDANWKIRKEALDVTLSLIHPHRAIKYTGLSDLVSALKNRLNDANKNLAIQSAELVAEFVKRIDKTGMDRYMRQLLPGAIALTMDNKPQTRAVASQTLRAFLDASSLDEMAQDLSQALAKDQSQLRREILTTLLAASNEPDGWGAGRKRSAASANSNACDLLAVPLMACLQDRTVDVRKLAVHMFEAALAKNIFPSKSYLLHKASDHFKGTALQTVKGLLETVDAGPPPSAASTTTTASLPTGTAATAAAGSSGMSGPSGASLSRNTSRTAAHGASNGSSNALTGGTSSSAAAGGSTLSTLRRGLSRHGGSTTSLASTAAASAQASSQASAMDIVSEQAFFIMDTGSPHDTREYRASQDRGMMKWSFDVPRKEHIELLRDQFQNVFAPSIHELLFSESHYRDRDYLQAMNMMNTALVTKCEGMAVPWETAAQRFISHYDIIFKYMTLRFYDTNTSMLMKCLEFTGHLLTLLDDHHIHMGDYEAGCFLPYLIQKLGDSKEVLRRQVHAILRQFCHVYPASKLFAHLLKALDSKNVRVRTECMEEVEHLLRRNGISVCAPQKALPVIAQQISDRDAGARSAALQTIATAYTMLGDVVYKYLGRLSDKDRSMVEEKIKRLPAAAASPPAAQTGSSSGGMTATSTPIKQRLGVSALARASRDHDDAGMASGAAAPAGSQPFSLDLDQIEGPPLTMQQRLAAVSTGDSAAAAPSGTITTPIPFSTTHPSSRELMVEYLVLHITSEDPNSSIDALKQLERLVVSQPERVAPHMDDITSAITLQIRIAFTSSDVAGPAITRLCKHLVNTMVQLVSQPMIASHLSKGPQHQAVQELLTRLLDPKLMELEQGNNFARALNVLMIRILENTNRNASFSILLELLEQSAHTQASMAQSNDPALALQTKYTELVMKCLWKTTKLIQSLLAKNEIDPAQLLLDVHHFLAASPPAEWKRRAVEGRIPQADMPLRTVKTIIHELVHALGDDIHKSMDGISKPQRSHAVAYIHQMLGTKASQAAHDATARSSPSAAHAVSASTPVSCPAKRVNPDTSETSMTSRISDQEIEMRLDEIFKRISHKEFTRDGIQELFAFRSEHGTYANTAIERRIDQTGSYFQGYIRRGLTSLEAEAEAVLPPHPAGAASGPTSASASGPAAAAAGAHPARAPNEGSSRVNKIPATMPSQTAASAGPVMHPITGQAAEAAEAPADAYKSTLARLQLMFDKGASSEPVGDMPNHSPVAQPMTSTSPLGSGTSFMAVDTDPSDITAAAAFSARRTASMMLDGPDTAAKMAAYGSSDSYLTQEPAAPAARGSPARSTAANQKTVAELKERLARMKQSMR